MSMLKTRNLTEDSCLQIIVKSFPPCLYREAMHLQCFMPTCFVRDVAMCTHKINVMTIT